MLRDTIVIAEEKNLEIGRWRRLRRHCVALSREFVYRSFNMSCLLAWGASGCELTDEWHELLPGSSGLGRRLSLQAPWQHP
jgi:hypothetical protein